MKLRLAVGSLALAWLVVGIGNGWGQDTATDATQASSFDSITNVVSASDEQVELQAIESVTPIPFTAMSKQ